MIAKENPIIHPAESDTAGERRNPPVIGVAGSNNEQGKPSIPGVLPILPVRNLVVFPGTIVPLTVGRPSSQKLLQESLPQSKTIGIFTQ